MVGDGRLEGLEQVLLGLELAPDAAGPLITGGRRLGLAQVDQVGPARVGRPHPEQPAVRVVVQVLLKLHLVHLGTVGTCFCTWY